MATIFISQMNLYGSIFICFVLYWNRFLKGYFSNCSGFPLSSTECCCMQSYFKWEQMHMKSANVPSAPFFPLGRAFFIYIGEREARKGENTNMKSPRGFLEMQQKNTTLKWRSQVIFQFPAKWQLQEESDLLGNVSGSGWKIRDGFFFRLWMGRSGGNIV